jgi:hypothetical protein
VARGTDIDITSVNMDRAFANAREFDPFAGNDSLPGFAGLIIMGLYVNLSGYHLHYSRAYSEFPRHQKSCVILLALFP